MGYAERSASNGVYRGSRFFSWGINLSIVQLCAAHKGVLIILRTVFVDVALFLNAVIGCSFVSL